MRGNYAVLFDDVAMDLEKPDAIVRLGSYAMLAVCDREPEYYSRRNYSDMFSSAVGFSGAQCLWPGYAFGPKNLDTPAEQAPAVQTLALLRATNAGTRTYNMNTRTVTRPRPIPFTGSSRDTYRGEFGAVEFERFSYEVWLIDLDGPELYGIKSFPAPGWPSEVSTGLSINRPRYPGHFVKSLEPTYSWLDQLWRDSQGK